MSTRIGNIDFDQFRATARHGTQDNAQASDGTGIPLNLAAFNADGSLTDAGIAPTSLGGVGGGPYIQIPTGIRNGVNVDFFLDFAPVSAPTGTPPRVPFWLVLNGIEQDP